MYKNIFMFALFLPVSFGEAGMLSWPGVTDLTGQPSFATLLSAKGDVVVVSQTAADGSQRLFMYDGHGMLADPGTLRSDNTGSTVAYGLSADGRVAVGMTDSDTGRRAFLYTASSQGVTDLGTLKSDDTGSAMAYGVSADGLVIVGAAESDLSSQRAFRYQVATGEMTDLGTLMSGNLGTSVANAVSASGEVIAGLADTDKGTRHAFRWVAGDSGLTDLGTLKTDGSGNSWSQFISADGRVIVGQSETDTGDVHLFRHNAGDLALTDPGTLNADNSGSSVVRGLSADGRVMVGQASAAGNSQHAFRHEEGDNRLTDLGTLRNDKQGYSIANGVSADGVVVVGTAEADNNEFRAFYHTAGATQMTDLGTLRSDNAGTSDAMAVSADGTVIAGQAMTDDGRLHAALWKITLPGPDPDITVVDVYNTRRATSQLAVRMASVLSLYQGALMSLEDERCLPGPHNYCVGISSGYEEVTARSRLTSGLYGAVRFAQAQMWTVGASLTLAGSTRLAEGYDATGGRKPGVGAFVRYQSELEGTGLNAEVFGAFLHQDVTVRRPVLQGTEAGHGMTALTGKSLGLRVDYGLALRSDLLFSPVLGLRHRTVYQDAYGEADDVAFPVSYSRTGRENTDLLMGLEMMKKTVSGFRFDGGAGAEISLKRRQDAFRGTLPWSGVWSGNENHTQNIRPYVDTGMAMQFAASSLGVKAGWQRTDYREDDFQLKANYTWFF